MKGAGKAIRKCLPGCPLGKKKVFFVLNRNVRAEKCDVFVWAVIVRNGKMNKAMGEEKSQKKYFQIKECKEINRI